MNKTCLFVALVVTTTLGSGHALAAPFPADATDSRAPPFHRQYMPDRAE